VKQGILLLATLQLYPGYVTRIRCEGRLFASAVGNEAQVRLEAFPKELGCGALLKPLVANGRTNLILETSAGTIEQVLEISPSKRPPVKEQLSVSIKGVAK
jgi:hypothetical protein